jgi:hypothetical protein
MKSQTLIHNVGTVTVSNYLGGGFPRLEVTAEIGIAVTSVSGVYGFPMNSGEGFVRWKNGKQQGVVEDNRLVRAGFYIKDHEGKIYYNIGSPFQSGYSTDMELLLRMDLAVNDWRVFSPRHEEHSRAELVNFPKDPDDFAGDLLVRLPDGHYIRFTSIKSGPVCVLNVGGHLSVHKGSVPNPNTDQKAYRAFREREEFFLREQQGEYQKDDRDEEPCIEHVSEEDLVNWGSLVNGLMSKHPHPQLVNAGAD